MAAAAPPLNYRSFCASAQNRHHSTIAHSLAVDLIQNGKRIHWENLFIKIMIVQAHES
jgi:hypothetical protein